MPLPVPLKKVVNYATGTVVGAQVATAVGLLGWDAARRRHRRPRRFPTHGPTAARVGDDEVTIYTFGRDLFKDMLDAIASAQTRILFETYIWKGDEIGQQFKEALIAAHHRGVEVYLVWDDFANLVVPRAFYRFPPGIHIKRHPMVQSPSIFNPRNTGRDHRKLLVVDAVVAFVGGYNIGLEYADRWRDTHARLVGPSVGELENAFVDYWNMKPVWLRPDRHPPRLELDTSAPRTWNSSVRVMRNSPRWAVYPIRNMYLEAIDKASSDIWLTHAYLIPDEDLVAALFAAADRGVDVRVIVPAESNHVIADWLARGFYDDLLAHGVRLLLYQGTMVHAKTATIDGIWSTIGTANLDRLSLMGNYEINVEFFSTDVATLMEEIFAIDQANCVELTLEQWRSRTRVAKFTEGLLAPWRPLL